jgi:predicted nucleotidyltransferase
LEKIRQNILKTLAYFDIFDYPLTGEEVRHFLLQECNQLVVNEILYQLIREHLIYNLNDFYSLQNKPKLGEIRLAGNKRAMRLLRIARRVAKILSWFPYVESVAVSGSLSKNFANEKADIDFFIITSSNRLWIARTCMHIFKKLTFLAGKQNWFCMNYYIDEMKMEIIEKNIFTAMEIVTLMPLQGINCFKKFIKANSWASHYFRVQTILDKKNAEIKKVFFRKCIERIFNSHAGDVIEKWLMDLTDKRWKKKTDRGRVNNHGIRMAMITDPHFSKPEPEYFQTQIINSYELRVQQLLQINKKMEADVNAIFFVKK